MTRLWLVFITALLAVVSYTYLGMHGVALWKIMPLDAYACWSLFYLLTWRPV